MDRTFVAGCVVVVTVVCSIVGSVTFYNLRTNVLYADLIKTAKDPLAARCAWNGDMQVCVMAGFRK